MNEMSGGTFIASIVALAAEAVFRSSVGEVVKDAYSKLKSMMSADAQDCVKAIENRPNSELMKAALAEIIDEWDPERIVKISDEAESVRMLMIDCEVSENIGAKLKDVSARNIKFGIIEVENGIGVVMNNAKAEEDIEIKTIRVGKPEGKCQG